MLSNEKNEALAGVPPEILEEYVLEQIRQFAVEFAQQLVPQITQQHLDLAFSRALYALSARSSQQALKLQLRFVHKCKFLGCTNMDCGLCKHNPHKTCATAENFDEAYADNQVLRARCDADVCVELFNASTGEVFSAPGVEVQLVAIDGEFYDPTASSPLHTIKTLLQSDNGTPILQSQGSNRAQINGTVVVPLQGGRSRLPDVFIADKNDTAKFDGSTAGKFALMALAVRRGEGGQLVAIDHVTPAVSNPFVVKTQRALNDYRKSAFPHFKDEITRLRFIGVVSANRLKDARAHLGQEVPVECVDTVQELKKLVEYAETNRKVENKLLEMLNMRGRHKHKWDSLRAVLADKIVYDDNNIRIWMAPDGSGQGLLYYAKQAQVVLDKPAAVVQNMMGVDGYRRLQVMDIKDIQDPSVQALVRQAEECWGLNSHMGWQILTQPIERVTTWSGVPITSRPAASTATGGGAATYPAMHGANPAAAAAAGAGGVSEMYPNIPPGGVASQFNAAAAAAGDQGGMSPSLRHPSDVAMSGVSDTDQGATGGVGAGAVGRPHQQQQQQPPPLPPAADDAHDSAFMRQHPFDNVERALQESEVLDGLRHPSDTSDAGTARAAAAAGAAAGGAANGVPGVDVNGGHKRCRGAGDDEGGESRGEAATGDTRTLYHRESAGRHLPVRRASPQTCDAPGAAASAGAAAATAGVPSLLDLPSGLASMLPSSLPSELPSFGAKDVAQLLEQLSSDLRRAGGSGGAGGGGAAAAAAAAGGGGGSDRQQQQDQDKGGGGQGGELVLTNSLSALNLANSLLPPTASMGGLGGASRPGAGGGGGAGASGALAPTNSSLLLPLSGDMDSLRLLSSLAFLHSNLRTEDSFKQVLNQVNLGSPRESGGIDALLREPAAAAADTAGGEGAFAAAAAAAAAAGGGGDAAAAAHAGDAAGGGGPSRRSRLSREGR